MHRILQVGLAPKNNLEQWLKQDTVHNITLIEPHPHLVQQLKQQYNDHPKLQIIAAGLDVRQSVQTLVDFNLPGFSSTSTATGLKKLFPGLQAQEYFQVNTISPANLLEQYGPQDNQTATLVIHAKGSEAALVQELINGTALLKFTDVLLYSAPTPLYEDSMETSQLQEKLLAAGYELIHEEPISPEWIESHFQRNTAQDQILLLTQQLKNKDQQLQEQQTQQHTLLKSLNELKKELEVKNKLLTQKQEELDSLKQTQKKMLEQLQAIEIKLKEREQQLNNSKKQVEELEHALQQEQQKTQQLKIEKNALVHLENRMEQLFIQQTNQIQQATNALGQHVTKSLADQRQHTQALTALQHYLEKGEQPLNFGAWSMSIDTLNYLVRQIEKNNYDVIIEFGSGTSTVVLAKAVAQRLTSQRYSQITKNNNKQLAYEDIESHSLTHATESQASSLLHTAEYDLPRQILSFEQDRSHFNQTKQTLNSHGVSQVVELVLAPLIPARCSAQPTEQRPLFYDAEKQLERLACLFEQRTARILVIVDGPFSPKDNPLIREPALGTVLQYLSAQPIDILLDDTQRSGEQQVLEHWQALCEERGLTFNAQPLDVVKGATWITVRPE